jgi:NAD(P)-dependent dehydrogenase (short-subunit alcohol dehydrogenase family)
LKNNFSLKEKIVVITGGGGLLGEKHAEAIAEIGGIPILFDIDYDSAKAKAEEINIHYSIGCRAYKGSVSEETDVKNMVNDLLNEFGHIDVLINNAALNPKMESGSDIEFTRFENYSLDTWNKEIAVGLTGAFICSKIIGPIMAKQEKGVIINISSDLGIIAPDQRIYKHESFDETKQPVKPVSYSVIKHGMIGLTKYLATYWAHKGVRSNALCPGGIEQDQNADFIQKLTNLIPLGRMAKPDEYKSAIQFLCSDASSYMNGSVLTMDGGRTCW